MTKNTLLEELDAMLVTGDIEYIRASDKKISDEIAKTQARLANIEQLIQGGLNCNEQLIKCRDAITECQRADSYQFAIFNHQPVTSNSKPVKCTHATFTCISSESLCKSIEKLKQLSGATISNSDE